MNKLPIKVLEKFGLLGYLNLNGTLVLNQKKFIIPIVQKTGFDNMFISESWMINLLKLILTNNSSCFVDVGVNIGQTLLKLKCVSNTVSYIGFEPNPNCVFYVNNLIKVNKFTNCHIIPVGVSHATDLGILNFVGNSITDSCASIISNFRPNQNIVRRDYVPLFHLDEIKDKIGLSDISVLKIDVEGAELDVLKSFYSLIKQSKPVILLEILPAYDANNSHRIERQNELIHIVTNIDYSVFRVIKQNDKFLYLKEISEIEIHSDLNQCEYLMIPNAKKELIKNYCR